MGKAYRIPYRSENTRHRTHPKAAWRAIPVMVTILLATHPAQGIPTQCKDTLWFKSGEGGSLDVSWNSPVSEISDTDGEIPAPGAESTSAPTVSMTPTSVEDSYAGFVDIEIEGLETGQRVILEKYKVVDPAVGITADSILQFSHPLQDGYFPEAGAVYNFNIPADSSDVDGAIEATLDFFEPNVSNTVGNYVYRFRSPTGAYVPVDIPFEVTAEISDQKFVGTVTESGFPVADAFVAVLNPLGADNDFVYGVTTDENGEYELFTAPFEEYDLVATAPGYVGAYGKGVSHYILEDETLIVDHELERGTRAITGEVVEAGDPSTKLAGVQLIVISIGSDDDIEFNSFTVGWTDENGAFSVDVTEGKWAIFIPSSIVFERGYSGTGRNISQIFDTTSGDSTGNQISLERGNSILYGTLTSSEPDAFGDPDPLPGVEIRAIR